MKGRAMQLKPTRKVIIDTDPGIELLTPPLSTIRLPLYDMGRAAAAALLAGTAADLPAATALPCPPVPRGSVGPP